MQVVIESLELVYGLDVLDSRGHLVCLFVPHFPDHIPEILARTGHRQSFNNITQLKASNWSNLVPNELHKFLLQLLSISFDSLLDRN